MPRALPWLGQQVQSKMGTSSSFPAHRNKRASSPDELVDEDLNTTGVITQARRKRARATRTPSTSPPPAPPDVEEMHAGFSADEAWMMVEDEFLSTAKMYTQHIHHAEYVRLKKLAKSRGQGTLQAIARPTDGRTAQSAGMRLRLEAEARAGRVRNGLREITGEDESDEEDPFMQDPQLAGLMTGSQRPTHDLSGLAKAKANTRAAAGFAKSPQKQRVIDHDAGTAAARESERPSSRHKLTSMESESDSTDDDDLDAPLHKPAISPRQSPAGTSDRLSHSFKASAPKDIGGQGLFKRFATKQISEQKSVRHTTEELALEPEARPKQLASDYRIKASSSTGGVSTFQRSRATSDFLAKRRAAREKDEQERQRKANQVDDVPTFLL